MSQPAPGFAPSLPVRPDLEAGLLEAMGRRDASTSLRLVQQLVHRRGVGALESLRCRSLAIEPDQQGWMWLSQLVAAEPIAGLSLQSAVVPDVAASIQPLERAAVAVSPQALGPTAVADGTVVEFERAVAAETADGPGSALESASASAFDSLRELDSAGEVGLSLAVHPEVDAGKAVGFRTAVGLDGAVELDQVGGFSENLIVAEPLGGFEPLDGLESSREQAPSVAAEPSVASVQSAGLVPAAAPQAAASLELDFRVETAVDAAFEALAAEFPGYGLLGIAEPDQAGLDAMESGPMKLDQPELVQSELIQSEIIQLELVNLELVNPELVQADLVQPIQNHQPEQIGQRDQTGEPAQDSPTELAEGWVGMEAPQLEFAMSSADLEKPPAELRSESQPYPSLEPQPRRRFSFLIPRPLDQELVGAEPATTTAAIDGSWDGQGAGESRPEQGVVEALGDDPSFVDQAARLWSRAGGRMAGLRDRMRSRLSLARVKTLVHDCVEEAVSSFHGSNPVAAPQQPDVLDQELGAAVALAPLDPWPLEQPLAAPVGGIGSELAGHQAPLAAFGLPLAGDSLAPIPVAAEAPARLSPTQQVRQRLLGRRQAETRPAPAPQALSDLRAWLAADDDLPRVS